MTDIFAPWNMTPEQIEERRGWIGGSDANIIMSGDPERVLELWKQKTGRPTKPRKPALPPMIGTATESLNAAWYEHETGDPVTDRGRIVELQDDRLPPMRASLDGICGSASSELGVWEAKHVGGFDFQLKEQRTAVTVAREYYAQLQHNMYVTDMRYAVISVFFDNIRWESLRVERDEFYIDALLSAEADFWNAVMMDQEPEGCAKAEVGEIVPPTKEKDMSESNAWADAAAKWETNRLAAKDFDAATAAIKALVPKDVARAYGHGIVATRDKRGAIRIAQAT